MMNQTRKLADILSDYFDKSPGESSRSSLLAESRSIPILPGPCSWEIHKSPERFAKTFNLNNKQQVIDFLSELVKYEAKSGHDASLRVEGLSVTIEVYTHDVNKITELDQEYSRNADFIYRDVLDFGKS